MDLVSLDHNYCKLGSPSATKCPTRFIFMPKSHQYSDITPFKDEEEVRVCDVDDQLIVHKSSTSASTIFSTQSDECWEDMLDFSLWTDDELLIFKDVLPLLKSYQLAHGTLGNFLDKSTLSVRRHLALSKAAVRLLRILSDFSFNRELFLWIHSLMKVAPDYSSSWMDVISFFNTKYRGVFDKMQVLSDISPLLPKVLTERPKMPHLPFFSEIVVVVLPPRPHWFLEPRNKAFLWHLSKFFQVKSVKPSNRVSHSSAGLSLKRWLRNVVVETRAVIKKINATGLPVDDSNTAPKSSSCRSKNKIVLMSWGAAAMLACQLAADLQPEESDIPISVIISICPLLCSFAHGLRGHLNDPLDINKLHSAMLFFTGQYATSANVDDIEDFRDKLPGDVRSRLIVVGGADDRLAICSAKQRSLSISQGDVDVAVMEEIYSFVSLVINGVANEPHQKTQTLSTSQGTSKMEVNSSAKRSAHKTQGPRTSKANKVANSQLLSLAMPSTTRIHSIPVAMPEPFHNVISAHAAASAQNLDQAEVTCHDYAVSSHTVSGTTSVGTTATPTPLVLNAATSEQSLRYMLSAGPVSSASEPVVIKRPVTTTNPTGITVTHRGPPPMLYRKKVVGSAVVTGTSVPTTDSSRSTPATQPSMSSSQTVSIINVNSTNNVFVLSSHVKD